MQTRPPFASRIHLASPRQPRTNKRADYGRGRRKRAPNHQPKPPGFAWPSTRVHHHALMLCTNPIIGQLRNNLQPLGTARLGNLSLLTAAANPQIGKLGFNLTRSANGLEAHC
jgi:hypothetical protein